MKQAKDIMTPEPYIVQSEARLIDEVKYYAENGITSAPVATPTGQVLGTLTEISLLRAYLKSHLNNSLEDKVIHHMEVLDPAVFVNESTPLKDLVAELVKAAHHRVVVRNSEEQITGIISPKDFLRFLSGEDNKKHEIHKELEETKDKLSEVMQKLKNTTEALKQYRLIYQDAPIMIHSVDANGNIQLANKKIHETLGYEAGELIGKTLFDLYSESYHQDALQGLKIVMDEGKHHSIYSSMRAKNGDKIRVDVVSSSLRDANGKFIGTISTARVIESDALLRALHGVLNNDDF